MEKTNKPSSRLVVSKTLKTGKEKILVSLTPRGVCDALLCFFMQFAGVFASMSPFGIAFYAMIFKSDGWVLNYALSLLGTIISGKDAFWSYAVSVTAVTFIFAVFEKLCTRTMYRAMVASTVFVAFTSVRFISSAFSSFDAFAIIVEAILLWGSVLMFEKGYGVITGFKKRSFISEAESICAYAFIALTVSALGKLPVVFGLRLGEIVSMLVIFSMALVSGRGSALTLAVLLGACGVIGSGQSSEFMGTYALGALLGSSFKKYGKVGVVLGFIIANTASSLLLSDSVSIVISITDSLIASVIFGFVPKKVLNFFEELSAKTDLYDIVRTKSNHENTPNIKKLGRIAENVGELGDIYEKAAKEKLIGDNYLKIMSREIISKVCVGCKNKDDCFKVNGTAYEAIREMWHKEPVRISAMCLPKEMRKKCTRCDSFAQSLKDCVQMMKTEKKWLSKLNESRRLIAHQLKSISQILKKECDDAVSKRDKELEIEIRTELDKVSLVPFGVFAKTSDTSFEIEIGFSSKELTRERKKETLEAVKKAVGVPIRFAGLKRSGDDVYLSFAPLGTYKASFGYATRAKYGEKVSGDSFNVICANSTSAVMALSDGMGSGEQAKEESRFVIEMLEKFLNAGFDCEDAVRLINSSLLLRGEKDSFATLDICNINLENATLSFTKLGACASYIKTNEGTQEINGESLPAGIIRNVKAKEHMLPFSSDALVVLVSDGVADIALKEPKYEGWIEAELEKLWGANPQIVAGKLLDKATKLTENIVHDDMTVLVGCISR